MASQRTVIDVSRICCNHKLLKLTRYNIGDSKSSVLICTSHVIEQCFLKNIFEVKLLDKKISKFSYYLFLFLSILQIVI